MAQFTFSAKNAKEFSKGLDKIMKPYDYKKTYLGPNGHWSKKYIPKVPPTCEILHPFWNKYAYDHDVAYEGDDYAGFWGWVKKVINRKKVETQRLKADEDFYNGLMSAIDRNRHLLSEEQMIVAETYAMMVFKAVNKAGWAFYKTGGQSDA